MVRPSVGSLLIVVLSCILLSTCAQFPKSCATNATTEEGVCCPTPDGFVDPCGGPGRGSCKPIPDDQDDLRNLDNTFQNDDRLNWPHRFFHKACSCEGNFFGYACHECVFGYRGVNCDVKYQAIRKDVTKLTPAEKKQFRDVVNHSKNVASAYVVLNSVFNQDPSTKPNFTSVSVYDYIVFLHYYASRHTVFRNDNGQPRTNCDLDGSHMDFAHKGSAFPTWHRAYMLVWERELQKASGEYDFTFPYWDWTDKGHTCDVCNNDLVGATNSSNPDGPLDSGSPFGHWHIICQSPTPPHNCTYCEPDGPRAPLTRKLSGRSFPEHRQVDYAMSLPTYDLPPYDVTSAKESFRNVLVGSVGEDVDGEQEFLHDQVHDCFDGPMDHIPLSANDPTFILHHTFIDKLLEMWIRKYEPGLNEMPKTGAPPGNNRNDYLVPFFPVLMNADYFVNSRQHGYDYDDMVVTEPVKTSWPATDNEDKYSEKTIWALSVTVVVCVLLLAGVFVTSVWRNKSAFTCLWSRKPGLTDGTEYSLTRAREAQI